MPTRNVSKIMYHQQCPYRGVGGSPAQNDLGRRAHGPAHRHHWSGHHPLL